MSRALVAALVVLTLSGCAGSSSPDVAITNARVWASTGPTTAVFFEVVNSGNAPDTLIGVETDIALASLHETVAEGDVTAMKPVEEIEIPARSTVHLEPGGLHVMLVDVAPLAVGDVVEVRLQFRASGTITIQVPVTEIETP